MQALYGTAIPVTPVLSSSHSLGSGRSSPGSPSCICHIHRSARSRHPHHGRKRRTCCMSSCRMRSHTSGSCSQKRCLAGCRTCCSRRPALSSCQACGRRAAGKVRRKVDRLFLVNTECWMDSVIFIGGTHHSRSYDNLADYGGPKQMRI